MHATASDIAVNDFTAHFTAELQQAQRDALQTIHKLMLHVAQRLTQSQNEEEDPAQARATTQRIRLCLQAARDILRLRAPSQDVEPPKTPRPRATRLWRKTEQDATASAPATQPRASAPSSTDDAQRPATLLAAAGTAASRFGERITSPSHDSALSTHDSPVSLPSSVPSVNSVVNTPPLRAPQPARR